MQRHKSVAETVDRCIKNREEIPVYIVMDDISLWFPRYIKPIAINRPANYSFSHNNNDA